MTSKLRRMRTMWRGMLLVLLVSPSPTMAAATGDKHAGSQVDPSLVGTWKLAQQGLDMYWQVRADGSYRYFGTSARPFEHWGRMTASGGRWATRWAGGEDGGTYTLNGDTWQQTGKVGTGTWRRSWKPGDGGSQVQCPFIDVTLVERLFGNATRGRADGSKCELRTSGVGFGDSLHISIIENAVARFVNVRKQNGAMRPVQDVPGIGNAAFVDGDSVHILKGARYAVVNVSMYPSHPDAVSNAHLVEIARSVASRI